MYNIFYGYLSLYNMIVLREPKGMEKMRRLTKCGGNYVTLDDVISGCYTGGALITKTVKHSKVCSSYIYY